MSDTPLKFTTEQLQVFLNILTNEMGLTSTTVADFQTQAVNTKLAREGFEGPIQYFDIPAPWGGNTNLTTATSDIRDAIQQGFTSLGNTIMGASPNPSTAITPLTDAIRSLEATVEKVGETMSLATLVTQEEGNGISDEAKTRLAAAKIVAALDRKPALKGAILEALRTPPQQD